MAQPSNRGDDGPLERLDEVTLRIPRSARPGMLVDGLIFADERLESLLRADRAAEQVANVAFLPAPHGPAGPPAFLPARPLTKGNLAALTERVRRRVIGWFRRQGFLDAHAAADMLAWENSGFSIDASMRITLFRLQLRVYCQSLEHLLRYCARPLTKVHATGGQRRRRALAV